MVREPNIKTFDFIEDMLTEISGVISGYMDNKKLLVAVIIATFHEDFKNQDLSTDKAVKKFAEKIIAKVAELEPQMKVKVRLGAKA
jgi:hypothetical protein